MEHSNVFDPYSSDVALQPLALIAIVVLGLATLVVPRRYAILPLLVMAAFIPQGQRIVVGAFNFNLIRVMVVFAWARILVRYEIAGLSFSPLDKWVVAWVVTKAVMFVVLWQSQVAVIYQLGQLFDAIGLYMLFRVLVRDWVDVRQVARSFAVLTLPVCVAFTCEFLTGHNVFSVFGGVPAVTEIRDGHLRCQGAFPHPIVAGCFFAASIPVILTLFTGSRGDRRLAICALVASAVIILDTRSSTPFSAVGAVIIGMAFFRMRGRMRRVRWAISGLLVFLHLVMKGPVWSLVGHLDLAGGSTGSYRSYIIDIAVQHFGALWMTGTRDWPVWAPFHIDIPIEYVLELINGGILPLILLVTVFTSGFIAVGKTWRAYPDDRGKQLIAWMFGVGLFCHLMTFIGVAYFGQVFILLYLNLAVVASLAVHVKNDRAVRRWVFRRRRQIVRARESGPAQQGLIRRPVNSAPLGGVTPR